MTEIPFNIRPDAFAGAGLDYLRYRPAYPPALLDHVRARSRANGSGNLLDLGCGPGSIALPLARNFLEVWAVDLEPDMIAVGRAEAARLGIGNVRWSVGRAEDADAPAGAFDLVTMGQSFHRFDQAAVIANIRSWLKPGGYVAALGGQSPRQGEEVPWRRTFQEVWGRWGRWERPGAAPAHPGARQPTLKSHEIFALEGFADVSHAEFSAPHVWTVESLIGNAFSASTMTRHALGADAARFEADVRTTLLALNPANAFPERLEFWCSLARLSPALSR